MPHQCQKLVLQDVPCERNMETFLSKRKKRKKELQALKQRLYLAFLVMYLVRSVYILFIVSKSNSVIMTKWFAKLMLHMEQRKLSCPAIPCFSFYACFSVAGLFQLPKYLWFCWKPARWAVLAISLGKGGLMAPWSLEGQLRKIGTSSYLERNV